MTTPRVSLPFRGTRRIRIEREADSFTRITRQARVVRLTHRSVLVEVELTRGVALPAYFDRSTGRGLSAVASGAARGKDGRMRRDEAVAVGRLLQEDWTRWRLRWCDRCRFWAETEKGDVE